MQIDTSKVRWVEPVPGKFEAGPPIKLLPVLPGETTRGFFLSDCVEAVLTHYTWQRTRPCTGLEEGCEECRRGASARRKGYAAVWTPGNRRTWILEVTDRAFDTCLPLCQASGLRGCRFDAWRKGRAKNSELLITVGLVDEHAGNLPPCPDVREIMCRIWFGKQGGWKAGAK